MLRVLQESRAKAAQCSWQQQHRPRVLLAGQSSCYAVLHTACAKHIWPTQYTSPVHVDCNCRQLEPCWHTRVSSSSGCSSRCCAQQPPQAAQPTRAHTAAVRPGTRSFFNCSLHFLLHEPGAARPASSFDWVYAHTCRADEACPAHNHVACILHSHHFFCCITSPAGLMPLNCPALAGTACLTHLFGTIRCALPCLHCIVASPVLQA